MSTHTISTRPSEAHVRVEHGETVLAESSRAVALEETGLPTRYYVPREDVSVDLTDSDTSTHCPYKGDATYLNADGVEDAFWIYAAPDQPDAKPIAGLLAPDPSKLRVLVDGDPQ